MKCSIHEIEMEPVCQDFVCGPCYWDEIENSPITPYKYNFIFEMVYDSTKHRKMPIAVKKDIRGR